MLVRLFVLGVAYEHETHGYEIKALAKLWGLERWAKIGFGSIYHAIGSLEKEAMIMQHGVVQKGNRPPRTTYRITPSGQATFLSMLREALRNAEGSREDIDLALAFAANLPSGERISLVQARLDGLKAAKIEAEASLGYARGNLTQAPWAAASLEHYVALLEVEAQWTASLVKRIGDFPPRDWSRLELD